MSNHVSNVALVGFGHVGRAVARLLSVAERPPGVVLQTICTRDAANRRVPWVGDDVAWTDTFSDVLGSDADIVVELIGGVDPAERWIEQALARGKSVVTANKQVVARSGARLEQLATAHGCTLRYEASVAGVVPVVRALHEGLAADHVRRIAGILNGTCNYILTRIETANCSFETALAEAQAYGLAEADPSSDLDGLDARAKLAILSALGFHRYVAPDAIHAQSIRGIDRADFERAFELGCTVRQIAWAECEPDGVRARVQPVLIRRSSTFARAAGAENVVLIAGERAGELELKGRGAGPEPTAVAVVSDVLSVAAGASAHPGLPATSVRVNGDYSAPHYLRFDLAPGLTPARALDAIQSALRAHDIGCQRAFEPQPSDGSVALVTSQCSSARLDAAIHGASACDSRIVAAARLPLFGDDWSSASATQTIWLPDIRRAEAGSLRAAINQPASV